MPLFINRLQIKIALLSLLLQMGLPLCAQQDSTRQRVLDEVVVSEKYRTKELRSTTPLQVVDVKLMKKAGAILVSDAVKLMNGVVVKDYGGIGGLKTISVRGLGSAHTAIAYDGVGVTDVQSGQVDLGKLSLENVAEISLSNGQSDNILQPAKLFASAGVLNITTAAPTFAPSQQMKTKAEVKGGSFGFFSPTLHLENRLTSTLVSSFTTNYLHADGAYPYTLHNGDATEVRLRENSDIDAVKSELNLYGDFADRGELRAKGMFYWSERGLPTNILYNTTAAERLLDRNYLLQASYKRHWAYRWQLLTTAKGYASTTQYSNPTQEYLGGRGKEQYHQQEYYLSATLLYRPITNLSLSLANDLSVNQMQSDLSSFARPTRETLLNAFAAKYVTEQLTATAHLLSTTTLEQVVQGTAADNRHHLSPALSLSVQPWESEELRLRLMFKDIFRLPTFNDLYYGAVGRRDLRPEKALEFNAGASWQHAFDGVLSSINLSADGFYNRVTDKIIAIPKNMFLWSMMNVGRVDIKGVELSLEARLALASRTHLTLASGYTYQRALDKTDAEDRLYNHQIPYTPRHTASLRSLLQTPWVDVSYTLLYTGGRYANQYNIAQFYIAPFDEHTLTLSRAFKWEMCQLEVQLEALNFTNTAYEIVQYYPMPGRQLRAGVSLNF